MCKDCNPDIPRLRKLVAWVEEQDKLPIWQSQWNQGDWVSERDEDWLMDYGITSEVEVTKTYQDPNFCGTAYCIAGKTAFDDGFGLRHSGSIASAPTKETEHWINAGCDDYAMEALGLSSLCASQLFSGSNDASDVRVLAEQIAGEEL